MSAFPCTLHSIRIKVEENRVVPVYIPGGAEPLTAVRHAHGYMRGIVTNNGWMLVQYPEKGLLGLPLFGESHSWQSQWENENIQVQVCMADGWTDVEDWNLIKAATGTL